MSSVAELIQWPAKRQVKDAGVVSGLEIQLTKTPIKGTSLAGKIGSTQIRDKAGHLYGKSSSAIGRISYTTGKIQLIRPRKDAEYEISYDLSEALVQHGR
jgi:hypothetical protein